MNMLPGSAKLMKDVVSQRQEFLGKVKETSAIVKSGDCDAVIPNLEELSSMLDNVGAACSMVSANEFSNFDSFED